MTQRKLYWTAFFAALGIGFILYRAYLWERIPDSIAVDSAFYDLSARLMLEGHGFAVIRDGRITPVYFHTPGYTVFLALIYRFFPINEPLTSQASRVQGVLGMQLILFVMTIGIYGVKAQSLFHQTKKYWWFVPVMIAFYVPFSHYSMMLLPETLAQWWVAVFLYVAMLVWNKHWHFQFWLGLWCGGLILIKPYFVYIPLVYMVWYMFTLTFSKFKTRGILLFVTGLVLVVGGWIARTYFVSGHLVPIQAGLAYVTTTSTLPANTSTNPIDNQVQPSFTDLFFWHTVHKWRELLSPTEDAVYGTSIWWVSQAVQIVFLVITTIGLVKISVVKPAFKLYMGIFLGSLLVHSLVWSQPRYFTAIMPMIMLLGFHGVDIKRRRWGKLVIGFLGAYVLTISPITTSVAYIIKSVLMCGLVALWGIFIWRSISASSVLVRACLTVTIVLLSLALWPGLLKLLVGNLEWAYVPIPLVSPGAWGRVY